jgi:hypothetical protein
MNGDALNEEVLHREIMAKARALLAANPEPDDVTDAEYEETGK